MKDPTNVVALTKTYTDNGLVATTKDSRNNTTNYTYDGFDRAKRRTFPNSLYTEVTSYDANSNVLSVRNRDASTVTFTYDALNRVATKAPSSMPTVTYIYDLADRLLTASKPVVGGDASTGTFTISYDTAGRAYRETYPDGKQFTNVLDANGNVTKTTWPDGYFVDRVYDKLNRLTDIKLNGSATAAATYTWDALSRPTAITRKNSTSTGFTWELDNDLATVSQNFAGPTLLPGTLTYTYGYNAAGEVNSQTVSDSLYMWHPGAAGTTSYGAADNVDHYPTVGGVSYSYNNNGDLTQVGATTTFGYNTEQQLTSLTKSGVSTTYNYDPYGRMVQTTSAGTTSLEYFMGGALMGDYSSAGALQDRYIYGALGEPLMKVSSGGVETFYHTDGAGSVVATTDNTGNVVNRYAYSPFGETATPLSGTKFGYQGAIFDAPSGSYTDLSGNLYSPALGRTNQDAFTLGSVANPGNPQMAPMPDQDFGRGALDMLANGSQTNSYYQDMVAQQAAEDARYQKMADDMVKHIEERFGKGGFGTGKSWLTDLDATAKRILDALRFILGDDDFEYLKVKHSDSDNIKKALEQAVMNALGGLTGKVSSRVIGGIGKQVEKQVAQEFAHILEATNEFIRTPLGRRFVDVTTDVARQEVKSGPVSLTPFVKLQVMKDNWIAQKDPAKTPVWLFRPNAAGEFGPSDGLRTLLEQYKIPYIISHK